MKSISYVVFALSVLMVAATIDAVPDPPAVSPHKGDSKVSCLREFAGAFGEQRLICDPACISPHVPLRRISLADATAPNPSRDGIALAEYATDPSPPVSK